MKEEFCLDRTAFKATNAKDADNHVADWKDKTPAQRMEAAFFLICHAYGINAGTRIDKTVFSMKKR